MRLEESFMKDLSLHSNDLKRYQEEIDTQVIDIENDYIEDFVNQSDPFTELHEEIVSCDRILSSMEAYLAAFHTDLGDLGEEIRAIQTQSACLLQRLDNRKSIVKMMDDLFEKILISKPLVDVIIQGPINESYINAIEELSQKTDSLCHLDEQEMIAAREIFPQMNLLKQAASEKIRDYFMSALALFKKTKPNVQLIQKQHFLAYRHLFQYIAMHSPEEAKQVREAYVAALKKCYHALFSKYIDRLLKLEVSMVDKNDWIVKPEDIKSHAIFKTLYKKDAWLDIPLFAFKLGHRAFVLTNMAAFTSIATLASASAPVSNTIIVPHLAESQKQKFCVEILFRSLERMMIDTFVSEFLFLKTFFALPLEECRQLFQDIFAATDLVVRSEIQMHMVEKSEDALGMLLCIRINREHEMALRELPDFAVMEPFFDEMNMILWPKFQSIVDEHIESMKKAKPKGLLYCPLLPVTQRFSHFYASILSLNEKYKDSTLDLSCQRLFAAYFELLMGVSEDSSTLASGSEDHQNIFLLNNIGFCFHVLNEMLPDSDSKFKEDLYNQYHGLVKELTERLVRRYFSAISLLNRSLQSLPASITQHSSRPSKEQIESKIKDILTSYPEGLNELNALLMSSFYSPKLGASIFRSVLERFIIMYKTAMDLTEQYSQLPGNRLIIQLQPMDIVLGEIRKFKTFISNVEPS